MALDRTLQNETGLTNKTSESNYDLWLTSIFLSDTLLMCCASVAFFFNLLNICAIILSKLYRKSTYQLVITLSASHVIIALNFCMGYFSKYYFIRFVETKKVLDIILYNIYHVGSMSCALTTIAISADLFVQNVFTFKYLAFQKILKPVLALIWIIPVTITECTQIGITLFYKSSEETFVEAYYRLRDNTLGFINVILAVICLILLCALNFKTYSAIRSLLKRAPREGESSKKSALTIFLIVGTYLTFYLPNWILGVIFILHYRYKVRILSPVTRNQQNFITALFAQLRVLDSVSDPLVYAFRISVIREWYKKLFLKLKFWQ